MAIYPGRTAPNLGANVFVRAFPRMELLHLLTHSQAPFSRVIQSLQVARMEFFKYLCQPWACYRKPDLGP